MKNLIMSRAGRIAGVVALAAALVPAAYANTGPALPNPDYFPEVGRSLQTDVQRPDDRASWAQVHGTQNVAAGTVVAQSSDDGFNWADGGIGAGGAIALMLVAAGSAVAVRRNRHHAASV